MARVDSPGIRFLTLRSREALPHYDESTQTSTTRLYLAMHPPSNSRNSAFSLHIWVSLCLTSSGWISPSVVSEHFWAFGHELTRTGILSRTSGTLFFPLQPLYPPQEMKPEPWVPGTKGCEGGLLQSLPPPIRPSFNTKQVSSTCWTFERKTRVVRGGLREWLGRRIKFPWRGLSSWNPWKLVWQYN